MSQNGSAQDDIGYRSKQIEVQAPIAVSIKHQNYGLCQKASNSAVNIRSTLRTSHRPILYLTFSPSFLSRGASVPVFSLCPHLPSLPQPQSTYLPAPSIIGQISPLTHLGPPLKYWPSPRQRMHPSARAIPSPEHTTPSCPGSWPRLQNA